MRNLTHFRPHNQHCSRFHRGQRNQLVIDAAITVAAHGDAYGVAVAIYSHGQLLGRDFRLLNPGEVSSPERAWLAGYYLARSLADEIAPGARILIVEARERRRAA